MLRLFRSARQILPSSKITTHVKGGQSVVLHRVRLNRPGIRARNILIGSAVVFACYTAYTSVVLSPIARFLDELDESGDELSEDERKEMDEVDPYFIAFPFTTKTVSPPPYSGQGPEWMEFVRLSKDQKSQQQIRMAMAKLVQQVAERHPLVTMKCGKDLKLRRVWIDLDFPYRPPPEFYRSGLLVTDDAFEWATQPVDSSTVYRTNRILWPSPLFHSTWAFAGTLIRQNILDFAKIFGYEPRDPPSLPTASDGANPGSPQPLPTSHNPDIQKAIQRIRQQATRRPEEVKDPRAVADGGASPAGVAYPGGKDGDVDKPTTATPDEWFPGHDTLRSLTVEPWTEFRKKWSQTWRRQPEPPPRGSVLVSGMVELQTSKAWIVIDVFAWYDPKTKSFDTRSLWMAVRRLQMRTQKPLRP